MKKRILSMILVIIMVMALMPGMTVMAEESTCTHPQISWSVDAENIYQHTGTCPDCGEIISTSHDLTWGWDENEHWSACEKDCGFKAAVENHTWGEWLQDVGGIHYRHCSCGYRQEERHSDSDSDLVCDICAGAMCWDGDDGNHRCNDCGWKMKELCDDGDDVDHICDVCDEWMSWICDDADNNHVCDDCEAHLRELCTDEDDDYICDDCAQELCDHWLIDPVNNGNGTHTGTCEYCGKDITEDCHKEYGYDWNETIHWTSCYCGQDYNEEPHVHTYLVSSTMHYHKLGCLKCDHTIKEEHSFDEEGICEICEIEKIEKIYDVYVGGIGLENGQYMDNDGNVTETKPEDGYAYYMDGLLRLNNYAYDGDGFAWKEDYDGWYTASIYATVDLALHLTGENELTNTSDVEDKQRDGIAAEQNLTIYGSGKLTVLADNDGIHVQNGDVTMESGRVSLGSLQQEIGDDGIDVDTGDVIILGGEWIIYSGDHGMDVNGDVIVHGGTTTVTAGDDGFDVEGDINIYGGSVDIDAEDYGMDAEGSIIIAGGSVDIVSDEENDYDGIYPDEKLEIYGGTVSVVAGGGGIYSKKVAIYGGKLDIEGFYYDDIYGTEIDIDPELLEDDVDYGEEWINDEDGPVHIEARDIPFVRVSAVDITCGENFAGATMQLLDAEGNVVEEWTSTDRIHVILNLAAGKYTLRNTAVPEGYTVSEDTTFTINANGTISTTGAMDEDGVLLVMIDREMGVIDDVSFNVDSPAYDAETNTFYIDENNALVITATGNDLKDKEGYLVIQNTNGNTFGLDIQFADDTTYSETIYVEVFRSIIYSMEYYGVVGDIAQIGIYLKSDNGITEGDLISLKVEERNYAITLPTTTGATVETDKDTAVMGEMVTITVTPETGKEISEVIVKDESGNEVPVTKNPDGTYTYEQPAGDVAVIVELALKKYTLTWSNGDGGSYERSINYGETITIPDNEFFNDTMRKTGYTLTGWVNAEGYKVGDAMPEKDLTFTAQYTEIPVEKPDDSTIPNKGDDSNLWWLALLFVSGAGIIGMTLYNRKKTV